MTEVYFSLGSNVGDRRQFLDGALRKLREKVEDLRASSTYRTEPWGNPDQPWFLNICVFGKTSLAPAELLNFVKGVEAELGRQHNEKWGPREIDIDILFYGSETVQEPGLKIPHPHLAERSFVLIPLSELAPDLMHPILHKTVGELAEKAGDEGVKRASDE